MLQAKLHSDKDLNSPVRRERVWLLTWVAVPLFFDVNLLTDRGQLKDAEIADGAQHDVVATGELEHAEKRQESPGTHLVRNRRRSPPDALQLVKADPASDRSEVLCCEARQGVAVVVLPIVGASCRKTAFTAAALPLASPTLDSSALLRFADMLEWVSAAIAMSFADCLWKVKHGARAASSARRWSGGVKSDSPWPCEAPGGADVALRTLCVRCGDLARFDAPARRE